MALETNIWNDELIIINKNDEKDENVHVCLWSESVERTQHSFCLNV